MGRGRPDLHDNKELLTYTLELHQPIVWYQCFPFRMLSNIAKAPRGMGIETDRKTTWDYYTKNSALQNPTCTCKTFNRKHRSPWHSVNVCCVSVLHPSKSICLQSSTRDRELMTQGSCALPEVSQKKRPTLVLWIFQLLQGLEIPSWKFFKLH